MSLDTYKVVVVGSSGVGKTSMVERLIDKTFPDKKQPTIGVEFKCFQTTFGDDTIKLNIWDTAGQEKFRSISKSYFRNAVGAVLVFSITDKQSFDDLDSWLNDLHSLAAPNAVIIVVGNKIDLEDNRTVSNSEALHFSERHNIEYIETSALDNRNIDETFIKLAKIIFQKVNKGEIKGNFKINAQQLVLQPSSTENGADGNRWCC
ncbi:Ras family protein [Histomonas meleagridis]|uniref:Ras family protein n=1 Tax=Histomonas meleagridis TaxID=135588 RepID=UPI00355AA95F|nr:Ras family protein [Histomonas meleagridis]KAH0799555.1 Ras family protein [Histomonas meleagridis]